MVVRVRTRDRVRVVAPLVFARRVSLSFVDRVSECVWLLLSLVLYHNIVVDAVVVVDVLAQRDCRSLSNRVPLSCPLCSSE